MLALTLLSVTAVLAEDPSTLSPPPSFPGVQRAVTHLDFERRTVTATAQGPQTISVLVRSGPSPFAPLIHLRRDFNAEMRASTRQIH